MNEKLLEIYDKCMEHNISIGIKYMLSDACIKITGEMLAYDTSAKKYVPLYCEKWVSIHEIKEIKNIDLITLTIDKVFKELINRKKELEV